MYKVWQHSPEGDGQAHERPSGFILSPTGHSYLNPWISDEVNNLGNHFRNNFKDKKVIRGDHHVFMKGKWCLVNLKASCDETACMCVS